MERIIRTIGLAILTTTVFACQESPLDRAIAPKPKSIANDYVIPVDGVVYPADAAMLSDDGSSYPSDEATDPSAASHCPRVMKGNPTGLMLTLQGEYLLHDSKTVGIPPYAHLIEVWFYVGTYLRSDGITEQFNCSTFYKY